MAAVFRGALAEFLQGYRHAVLSLGQRAAERRRADAQAVHATRARQDVLDDLDALREMEDAAGGGGRAHRQDEGEGVGGAGRRSDGESVSLLELVVHTRALRGQLRDLASICGCAKEGKVGGGDGLEGGHILLDALFLRVEGQRGAGVQGTFLRCVPSLVIPRWRANSTESSNRTCTPRVCPDVHVIAVVVAALVWCS